MERAVIIQCSDNHHAALLDWAEPIHREYARAWGFDYWCVRGSLQPPHRHAFWNKIALIMSAFTWDIYSLAVWLDADALIVDHTQDLRQALPEGKFLGMSKAPDWMRADDYHLAGVFYARHEALSEMFFADAYALGEREWNDEWVFNRLRNHHAHYRAGIKTLDPKWHAHAEFHPLEGCVVAGFHNQGTDTERLARMKALWSSRRQAP